MLTILALAFVALFMALIPTFSFEDGHTLKALLQAAIMWPLVFVIFKVISWLRSMSQVESILNRHYQHVPAVSSGKQRAGRIAPEKQSTNSEADDHSDSFKVPLSMRAITANKNVTDPKEAERLHCAQTLSRLRDKTDAASLTRAAAYLDHADFEVRGEALDVVSYLCMGAEKPRPDLMIKKIIKIYNELIAAYDAGKISDEEVKEVGEGCLLALFRIGGWEFELVRRKEHIEPLKGYMNEFLPKENPYEDYQPMKDPESSRAANPPIGWLQKRDFQQFKLDSIEQSGVRYEIAMLINKKQGLIAFCVNGELCNITTRLTHTDYYNSGNSYYTCLRPDSAVVLPGKMLDIGEDKLAPRKFEYNEYKLYWEADWSQIESGEVYNTVVYDQYNCYLRLKPAERKGEFDISTSVDTTT